MLVMLSSGGKTDIGFFPMIISILAIIVVRQLRQTQITFTVTHLKKLTMTKCLVVRK
jgi:hypothetical protein